MMGTLVCVKRECLRQTESRSFLCVIVTVTTSSVGDGVISFEDVFTSVAVTVCVEVSMMVVTTWKAVRESGLMVLKIE